MIEILICNFITVYSCLTTTLIDLFVFEFLYILTTYYIHSILTKFIFLIYMYSLERCIILRRLYSGWAINLSSVHTSSFIVHSRNLISLVMVWYIFRSYVMDQSIKHPNYVFECKGFPPVFVIRDRSMSIPVAYQSSWNNLVSSQLPQHIRQICFAADFPLSLTNATSRDAMVPTQVEVLDCSV